MKKKFNEYNNFNLSEINRSVLERWNSVLLHTTHLHAQMLGIASDNNPFGMQRARNTGAYFGRKTLLNLKAARA